MASADDYAQWIVNNADKRGTPEFDTVAQAYQQAKIQAPAPKQVSMYEKTAKSDNNMDNFNAAVGGTLYAPWLGVKAMLGKTEPNEVSDWKKSMAGLWTTPMGKVGTVGGGMAALAPAVMAAGASVPAAAAAGGAWGLMQPEDDWLSRAKNAVIGTLGSGGGQAVGNALAARATQAAIAPAAATPLELAAKKAVDAGYKVAPNEAGQQSALQWVGGQVKTQQTMASKNVSNTNRLAAQEVGLPDAPVGRQAFVDALDNVRDKAGQAYQAVRNIGVIPSDPQMKTLSQHIEGQYNNVVSTFKSLRSPEIETLIQDLKSGHFDANGLVEAVKQFRNEGFANLASRSPGDVRLGRVQLQAQNALESLADRALTAAGQPEAVKALQDARQTIAKTWSVQNAMDANGNVVASKLSNQLANGKPLSGNLETIAQTATAFPKSLQHLTATPPAFSALDFMTSLLSGGKEAALLAARPIARAIAASEPYQKAFMGPSNGTLPGLLSSALDNPAARFLQASVPAAGLLTATR